MTIPCNGLPRYRWTLHKICISKFDGRRSLSRDKITAKCTRDLKMNNSDLYWLPLFHFQVALREWILRSIVTTTYFLPKYKILAVSTCLVATRKVLTHRVSTSRFTTYIVKSLKKSRLRPNRRRILSVFLYIIPSTFGSCIDQKFPGPRRAICYQTFWCWLPWVV